MGAQKNSTKLNLGGGQVLGCLFWDVAETIIIFRTFTLFRWFLLLVQIKIW